MHVKDEDVKFFTDMVKRAKKQLAKLPEKLTNEEKEVRRALRRFIKIMKVYDIEKA